MAGEDKYIAFLLPTTHASAGGFEDIVMTEDFEPASFVTSKDALTRVQEVCAKRPGRRFYYQIVDKDILRIVESGFVPPVEYLIEKR